MLWGQNCTILLKIWFFLAILGNFWSPLPPPGHPAKSVQPCWARCLQTWYPPWKSGNFAWPTSYATNPYSVIRSRQVVANLKENENSFKTHLVSLLWLDPGANCVLQKWKSPSFTLWKVHIFSHNLWSHIVRGILVPIAQLRGYRVVYRTVTRGVGNMTQNCHFPGTLRT